MRKIVYWLAAASLMSVRADPAPFADFVRPSRDCRPETWFHLIGGNVAKEGLEADLDAIRAAGISGIQFFHGQFGGVWPGMENRQIPCLSPKWEEILSFVAEDCERKGLSFKMQNCPGWSMSGGPWIKPENAMRNLTYSRMEVTGDGTKSVGLALAEPTLPTPENPCDADGRDYRDLFVLAFPTPVGDGDADLVPTKVSDGRFEKALAGQKVDFRPGENPSVELGFADPVTIRAIEIPSERQLNHAFCYDPRLTVRVEAKVGADWTVVAEQPVPPGNWEDLVPQTVALDERTSDRWRLTFLNEKALSIPYLRLKSGARLNNWEALAAWTLRGLVRRTCPRQDPATWVDARRILDLTESFRDGTLRWTPPPGRWTVLRIGHVNNGMKNGPAPKEATGWECNKLDPAGIDCNFNAYIGRFADGILKGGRLKGMVVDSWECRRQTWTARMEEEFRARAGYELRKRLPAVFGYVLGSPDETERFLLDWRRTIGALVEENYYRRFVELGHRKNLHVQYETAMGDVMPGDLMRFWKWADTPMCEFWSPHDNANGFVGSHDFKPVMPCVSAAHLYGKRRIDAEAFTSMGLKWDETLRMLKGDANRHFARGVTHLVFHTYTHNPRTDWKLPGTSFGHCIGTPFIRGQVWWRFMPEFTDYCARCTTMFERGDNVADVLRYLGDELGHRPSEQEPALPGYKVDYLNTDALMERLTWRNGAFETPEGLRWRVLWVPDCVRLLPSSMARLAELAGRGARIAFDRLPESAATAVEGADAELSRQTDAVRKGANVTVGLPLADVVRRMGLEPDVTAEGVFWNHRCDERADWYFIAAEDPAGFAGEVSFRTTGPVELWDAVTGEHRPAVARTQNGRTVVALDLSQAESAFVVFRSDALPPVAPAKQGAPVDLGGPWTVAFPSGWGAPASVEVAALRPLKDLPELDDEAKAFSGTVSYRRSFASDGKPVSLDLGDVASVAEVFINGRKVRTLWAPPYRCDLSGFVKPGANELRVDVTDTWFNRLAYDAKLPEPSRKTWTIAGPKAGTPLRPSGLLGPVRLLPTISIFRIDPPADNPEPLPLYTETAIGSERLRKLAQTGGQDLDLFRKDLQDISLALDASLGNARGGFRHERATKRLEMAENLASFARRQLAKGDRSSLGFVELALSDLGMFRSCLRREVELWKTSPDNPDMPCRTLNIRDFGAAGDGKTDDAAAFAKAFAAVADLRGAPAVLRIPAGDYLILSTKTRHHLLANGIRNCTVAGESPESTRLVFGDRGKNGAVLQNCANVTVRDVDLRYRDVLFCQGTVLERDLSPSEAWAVIRPDAGTMRPDDPAFCRTTGRGDSVCSQFTDEGRQILLPNVFYTGRCEALGDGTYKVYFNRDSPEVASGRADVRIGAKLMLIDRDNSLHAVRTIRSEFCNFERVWVRNSRSGAFTVSEGRYVTARDCRVFPLRKDLMLSTNADTFFNSRGSHLSRCVFRNMNDDGCNSLSSGKLVAAVSSDRRTVFHRELGGERRVGDIVQLLRPTTGEIVAQLHVKATGKGVRNGTEWATTTFEEVLPPDLVTLETLGRKELSAKERYDITHAKVSPTKMADYIYAPPVAWSRIHLLQQRVRRSQGHWDPGPVSERPHRVESRRYGLEWHEDLESPALDRGPAAVQRRRARKCAEGPEQRHPHGLRFA